MYMYLDKLSSTFVSEVHYIATVMLFARWSKNSFLLCYNPWQSERYNGENYVRQSKVSYLIWLLELGFCTIYSYL